MIDEEYLDVNESNDDIYENYLWSDETDSFIINVYESNDEVLQHFGVGHDDDPPGRGSGRYEFGSGENPGQHGIGSLKSWKSSLLKQGYTEVEAAKMMGFKNTNDMRKAISLEKDRREVASIAKATELYNLGYSKSRIAKEMGVSDTTVANLLKRVESNSANRTNTVVETLKNEIADKKYIDVGAGIELQVGVSRTKLDTAIKKLQDEEGYQLLKLYELQMSNPNNKTTRLVLCGPDGDYKEIAQDHTLIRPIQSYVKPDGKTVLGLLPPKSIDSDRVKIRYAEEGGVERDGVIQLRRGVEDISLGRSTYAQVRIAVDDTHFMKGMAVYADDSEFPPGIDVIYNTNKKIGTDKYDVYKPMETNEDGSINMDNPFGATIKDFDAGGQRYYTDSKTGEEKLSLINKVNDQGDWGEWTKTISAQMLSKQPYNTVKRQLQLSLDDKRYEYDEIMSIENPALRKKLLYSFSMDCDATACHLKAKAFPDQRAQVIIAIPSLKDNEIFAPNYEHGEWLGLIRYPFATTHECPKVRVNNKNEEALKTIGINAPDAIGINARVMAQMSGADSDGDNAVCIPLKSAKISTPGPLKGLEGFDTKDYQDKSLPKMSEAYKQKLMGMTTNLVTDMQIKKECTEQELIWGVKQTMVVIDAKKHSLDYKKAAIDNHIEELKAKYQTKDETGRGGAGTLITRANSDERIDERRLGSRINPITGKKDYQIDSVTGELIWVKTGRTYIDKKTGKEVTATQEVPRMSLVKDARELYSSKTNPAPVETLYADYANGLKSLANKARLSYLDTPNQKKDSQAAKEYEAEAKSLIGKLNDALLNSPRERQAQSLARSVYNEQLKKNPALKEDKSHLKRLRQQCLTRARDVCGAKKPYIKITEREWEAINKGALSNDRVTKILANAKDEEVKSLALPKREKITDAMVARIKAYANDENSRYSNEEIAERFGISVSTVARIASPNYKRSR